MLNRKTESLQNVLPFQAGALLPSALIRPVTLAKWSRFFGKGVARGIDKRGVSKFGQRLDEIGEVLANETVKGKYSGRIFDPNKAGGVIRSLDWKSANITEEGISTIEKHLVRFGPIKQNQKAIQRLKDIQSGKILATDFDKRFYTHELNEYQRFKEMKVADDVYDGRYYEHVHTAALEDYHVNERIETIYHPSSEATVNEELTE